MIYSAAKAEDVRLRIGLLEDMEMLLRMGYSEAAQGAGKASKHLADRIKSHDYSKEDSFLVREKQTYKSYTQAPKGNGPIGSMI